jgi:hypothetical protein
MEQVQSSSSFTGQKLNREGRTSKVEDAIDFAFEARLDYSIGFSSLRGF